MAEIVEGELATKQDIKILENKLDQMEYRLTVKLIAILVPVLSLTIAIMTFVIKHL